MSKKVAGRSTVVAACDAVDAALDGNPKAAELSAREYEELYRVALSEALDLETQEGKMGKKKMSEEMAKVLQEWLESGESLSEFWEINEAELGAAQDYDLREFVEDDAGWVARKQEAG